MTVQLKYLGVSEAFSIDGRALLHLAGWDPPFFSFTEFPATWPLVLLAILESDGLEDSLEPGAPVSAELSITSPEGKVIAITSQVFPAQPKQKSDIPLRIQVAVATSPRFQGPGDFKVHIHISAEGIEVSGDRMIYVRPTEPTN